VATPDPERLRRAFERAGLRPPIPIGVCVPDPGMRTLGGRPMPAMGFEHTFDR
jgi:hypothetical protein